VATIHQVAVKGQTIQKFVTEDLKISMKLWTAMLALILLESTDILPLYESCLPVLASLATSSHALFQVLDIYSPTINHKCKNIVVLIHLLISGLSALFLGIDDFESIVVMYDLTAILFAKDFHSMLSQTDDSFSMQKTF
jgi:hypothetical protein